jgi:hypothetical protein
MDDTHDCGAVIDGEKDSVRMRSASVAGHTTRMIRIEALRRNGTSLGMLIKGENYALETVEPFVALLRRARHDPEVQLFELGFRVVRDLNAVCHACGGAD